MACRGIVDELLVSRSLSGAFLATVASSAFKASDNFFAAANFGVFFDPVDFGVFFLVAVFLADAACGVAFPLVPVPADLGFALLFVLVAAAPVGLAAGW
jgi:hypothetical protein